MLRNENSYDCVALWSRAQTFHQSPSWQPGKLKLASSYNALLIDDLSKLVPKVSDVDINLARDDQFGGDNVLKAKYCRIIRLDGRDGWTGDLEFGAAVASPIAKI